MSRNWSLRVHMLPSIEYLTVTLHSRLGTWHFAVSEIHDADRPGEFKVSGVQDLWVGYGGICYVPEEDIPALLERWLEVRMEKAGCTTA